MASVVLYHSTGFTPTNLPYDEAALNSAAASKSESVTLDLCQIYMLDHVRVKGFESDVMDVDYIKLTDGDEEKGYRTAFYVVMSYTMVAPDIAELALVPDPGLTAGGWGKIHLNTGTFTRAYDLNGGEMIIDGMLQITERPQVYYESDGITYPESTYEQGEYCFIASTADLTKVPTEDDWDKVAYTVDGSGNVKYAFVPTPVAKNTNVRIRATEALFGEVTIGSQNDKIYSFNTVGYAIYDYNNPKIQSALNTLRAYGYESVIIGSWRVPGQFITDSIASLGDDNYTQITEEGFVEVLVSGTTGTSSAVHPSMSPDRLYEANESLKGLPELINHAEAYKVGIINVPTGARIERRRAEITGNIYMVCDPRQNGGPFFILQDNQPDWEKEIFKDNPAYIAGELQRCSVQGATWERLPIIYEGGSGRQQDYMKMYQRQQYAIGEYEFMRDQAILEGMGDFFSSANPVRGVDFGQREGDPASGMMEYRSPGMSLDMTGALAGGVSSLWNTYKNIATMDYMRERDSKMEMSQYVINNKLVAPQMTSQTIEGIQQWFGNYSILYALYPTDKDLTRFGEIAAMFGVACNRPVDASIKRRTVCSYYKGNGITVTTDGKVPKYVREDISNLLNTGVRLWSIKPRKLTAADWVNREGSGE